jgi:ribosomal-protein-serine acetyltransferase
VEIEAAIANSKSRAIPERLGFLQEGIRRHSVCIRGEYFDMAVYGMLASDWQAAQRLVGDQHD